MQMFLLLKNLKNYKQKNAISKQLYLGNGIFIIHQLYKVQGEKTFTWTMCSIDYSRDKYFWILLHGFSL